LLTRLRDVLPAGVGVTILADRGFGDTKLYNLLQELKFDFIIRFKVNILVTAKFVSAAEVRCARNASR
jgi:hypothetical protein